MVVLKLVKSDVQDDEFPITKPDGTPPKGSDWLRSLENETRFVCKLKRDPGSFLDTYGIAAILDEAILLYDFQVIAGSPFRWVLSDRFSRDRDLIAILPEAPPKEEDQNEQHHQSLPEPRSKHDDA